MSCEWCVYRDKKYYDICKSCPNNEPIKPKFELGKVDLNKLGRLLIEKQKKDKEKGGDAYK